MNEAENSLPTENEGRTGARKARRHNGWKYRQFGESYATDKAKYVLKLPLDRLAFKKN